jgi:hypothetical protein
MGQQADLGGYRPMQVVKALEIDLKIGLSLSLNLIPFQIQTSQK